MKSKKRRTASKSLRAIQTSRWHTSPRHHTGRLLPRRHTSYPTLIMILLCTGVFLAGWTSMVTASPSGQSDYTVHASVPGTPPAAATVEEPLADTHADNSLINVSGNCDTSSYVSISRNGFVSGVTMCDATGHYHLSVSLLNGLNQLVAKSYNFANTAGPDSTQINVYYSKPGAVKTAGAAYSSTDTIATSEGSSQQPSAGTGVNLPIPLTLQTDYQLRGFYSGQESGWQANITGGTAPYAVNVEWGDGNHDLYSRAQSGMLTMRHTYKKQGGYKGNYTIKIYISDSAGLTSYLQVFAVVNSPLKSVAGANFFGSGGAGSGLVQGIGSLGKGNFGHLVKYAWPSYGIVILMLLSFWLGERRELDFVKLPVRNAPTRKSKRN